MTIDHLQSESAPVVPFATFEIVWAGDVAVVRASGEIDAHSARTLDTICDSFLVPGVEIAVRLDASKIAFIDCAGVRGLMAVSEKVAAAGGTFAVTTPSDRVAWLLDLCRVDLTVRPTAKRARGARRTRVPRIRHAG